MVNKQSNKLDKGTTEVRIVKSDYALDFENAKVVIGSFVAGSRSRPTLPKEDSKETLPTSPGLYGLRNKLVKLLALGPNL